MVCFLIAIGLTILNVSAFDTSSVTDMAWMFSDCSGLTSLDVNGFDTSSVTGMGSMFSGCSKLTTLDLSGFDTSNVTSMGSMFSGCSKLTTLDVSGFDTSNVTGMAAMFNGCDGLTTLDVSGFDTSRVTNMEYMFRNCKGLTTLDLSGFDTSSVTTMQEMFSECNKLTTLDVSEFDTTSVTNMRYMFNGCSGLTTLDVGGFDTSSVTNMGYMFYNCSKLTTLDLSGFDTSSVTDMGCMFYYCSRLKSITLGSDFSFNGANSTRQDTRLNNGYNNWGWENTNGDHFDVSNILSSTYIPNNIADTYTWVKGTLAGDVTIRGMAVVGQTLTANVTNTNYAALTYQWYSNTTNSTTGGTAISGATNSIYTLGNDLIDKYVYVEVTASKEYYNDALWVDITDEITNTNAVVDSNILDGSVTINDGSGMTLTASVTNTDNATLSYQWYSNTINSTIGGTAISGATSATYTVADSLIGKYVYCEVSATKTGYNNATWKDVVDTWYMDYSYSFNNGTHIILLNTYNNTTATNIVVNGTIHTNGTTYNVKLAGSVYKDKTNLTSITINSGVKAGSCYEMFRGCTSLTSLDLSNLDTSETSDMGYMFAQCTNLATLDISNFDTSHVTKMNEMFFYCSKLLSLDLSSFNTQNVTNMSSMFLGCSKLASLDVSGFDTQKVNTMSSMFSSCSSLPSLNLSNFDTSKVTNMMYMFDNCISLTSLDLSNFNTSKVNNMGYMFDGCTNLTNLDISGFNTSLVTNMSGMFIECKKLTTLDVSSFDTQNVISMASMFQSCGSLTSLDLSNFNTSKVTTMATMFGGSATNDGEGCHSLTTLDLSSFDTSNVTNMNSMFFYCYNLTSLDISSFDTSNVTNMGMMFFNCEKLTELDVSGFNTSNVTIMDSMFYDCNKITTLDVSGFDTSNVLNMEKMFYYCTRVNLLDLSSFDTSQASMKDMFKFANNLSTLTLGADFSFNGANSSIQDSSLNNGISGQGWVNADKQHFNVSNTSSTTYIPNNVADTYVWYRGLLRGSVTISDSGSKTLATTVDNTDEGILTYQWYSNTTNSTSGGTAISGATSATYTVDDSLIGKYIYCEVTATKLGYDDTTWKDVVDTWYMDYNYSFNNISNTVTFTRYNNTTATVIEVNGTVNTNGKTYDVVLNGKVYENKSNLTSITINLGVKAGTSCYRMFYGCSGLTTIDLSGLDTSSVTDMWSMFYHCTSLTTLDVSGFDTSSVTNMREMFQFCSKLSTLNVSGIDTSSVTNMWSMFQGCSGLTTLDVSGFDTSSVTSMSYMFSGCSGLTTLDVSGFNTSSVTSMSYMFSGCSGLTTLDVSGFNTSSVTDMSSMFQSCSELITIDLSGFDTSSVTSMIYMFEGCSGLTTLNLSRFDTSNVTTMFSMFWDCERLTTLDLSGFDTSRVTDMRSMFTHCYSLTTLDLSGFDTSSVTNMDYMNQMFFGCLNLKSITLGTDFSFKGASDTIQNTNLNNGDSTHTGWRNTNGDHFDVSHLTNTNYIPNNVADTYIWDDIVVPTVTITKVDYNTFTWTASDENGVFGYQITTTSTAPLANDANWVTSGTLTTGSYDIDANTAQTYYVWAKDEVGNVSNATSISAYQLTKIQGNGTTLTLKENNASGVELGTSAILTGTDVYVDGEPSTGYQDLLLKNNGTTISDGSIQNVTGTTTIESQATATQYTITYNLDGGTNAGSNVATYTVEDAITISAPTKTDYTFLGWTGSNGDTPQKTITIPVGTTGNLEYTANWSYNWWKDYTHSENNTNHTMTLTKYNGSDTELTVYATAITDSGEYDVVLNGRVYYNKSNITSITINQGVRAGTSCYQMFNNCSGLTTLDLSSFDTGNVTNMSYMFCNCSSLSSLDVSNFNTSNVTDMNAMFIWCSKLTTLDLSSFDTGNVTTMGSMFNGCNSLTTLDVSSFDTGNVTAMGSMFHGCNSLTTLDVSSFDTGNVINMYSLFRGCSGLTTLDVSSFDTGNVTDMSWMFRECSSLTTLDLSNFDTSNVTDMSLMFSSCERLTSIDLSSFDTSNVTDMKNMFQGCSNLTTLDLSNFNTSSVTHMGYMFCSCTSLTTLDVSEFDTSNVTNMSSMFDRCKNLLELDLSNFDTSNVTNMDNMFNECNSLTTLNLSSFDTSNVTIMGYMFDECSGLTTLDLSSFDTNNVTYMRSMFRGCRNLTTLDLSGFDTSNVTDMIQMFGECSKLSTLKLGADFSFNGANDTRQTTELNKGRYLGSGYLGWENTNGDHFDVSSLDSQTYIPNNVADTYTWAKGTLTGDVTITGVAVVGQTLTASVTNPYNATLSYQWYSNTTNSTTGGTAISGATNPKLSLSNDLIDKYIYVEVTATKQDYNTATWIDITDSVTNTNDVVDSNILDGSITINDGSGMTLTASVTNTDNATLSYQWYSNTTNSTTGGTVISGATRSTYTINNSLIGKYIYCQVTATKTGYTTTTWLDIVDTWYKDYTYSLDNTNHTITLTRFNNTSATSIEVNGSVHTNGTNYDVVLNGEVYREKTSLTSIVINQGVKSGTNCSSMFYSCINLTTLDISNFDTSNATDMSYMFNVCKKVTTIDVSNFNTNNVTNMECMFGNCEELTSLDVSGFNTSNVTNMSSMFRNCKKITTLDLSDLNTSNVTDMSNMFVDCSSLTSVNLEDFETGSVTDMSYMFENCSALSTLNLDDFDTNNVTSMIAMFLGCSSLTSLDLSEFDTSNVTDMSYMFTSCENLASLNITSFDTGNVTNMSSMFASCKSLTTLNLSHFETDNVTNMNGMFHRDDHLTYLNVSNFDTSNVTDMSDMFFICSSLSTLDVTSFDTSSVVYMGNLFYWCTGLTSLDLSSFDTSSANSMNDMFNGCSNLSTLTLGADFTFNGSGSTRKRTGLNNGNNGSGWENTAHDNFSVSSISNTNYIPNNVADTYTWDVTLSGSVTIMDSTGMTLTTNIVNTDDATLSYQWYSNTTNSTTGGTAIGGATNATITLDSSLIGTDKYVYCVVTATKDNYNSATWTDVAETWYKDYTYNFDETNNVINLQGYTNSTATVIEVNGTVSTNGKTYDVVLKSTYGVYKNKTNLTSITINPGVKTGTSCQGMFAECSNLTTLDVSNLDTSEATDMNYMFAHCTKLTTLDVSNFVTDNVTDMSAMFNNCNSLTALDVTNIDTSNVTSMKNMFYSCSNLTNLDVSGFDTGNVTNMNTMFKMCSSLTSLDLSDFDTSNVTDMSWMFDGCEELTTLDISNFDTSNVTNMSNMFKDCKKLISLDLSHFDTGNVTNMSFMFQGCSGLTAIDVTSFNTEKVTTMLAMFSSCRCLTTLNIINFDTSNVTDMKEMFNGCSELISLDLSSFNTSNITSTFYMFLDCSKLKSLDLSNFDTSNVTSMEYMFANCSDLSTLKLGADFKFVRSHYFDVFLNNGDSTHKGWKNTSGNHFDVRNYSNSNFIPDNVADTYVWDDDYVVTFNKNDGSGTTSTQTFNYGTAEILDENAFSRTGYIFLGWSADPDATEATYTDEQSVTNVNNIQNTIYDTTTLYGVWRANEISLQGGTQSFTYNPSNSQSFTIQEATNGTGSYTYSESPDTVDPDNHFTISGRTVTVAAGTPSGTYTYIVRATDNESGKTADATFTITINNANLTGSVTINDASGMNITANVTNTDNATLTYQWYSNTTNSTTGGTAISGATNATITLDSSLIGTDKYVYCVVTATKDNYNTATWTNVAETWYKDYTYNFDETNHTITLTRYINTTTTAIEVNGTVNVNGTTYDVVLNGSVYYQKSNLTSIIINSGVETGTSCNSMFYGCQNLTTLDVSGLDTSAATDMNDIFVNCSSLTELDLSGLDTSHVTYMSGMFAGCSSLTELDLSGLDTTNVTDMSRMFGGCSSLTEIDFTGFDTNNVTMMGGMFGACSSLTSLDLSEFDTSNVTNMNAMFNECTNLISIDLSSFDTGNVTDMTNMFRSCEKLITLDLSNFDTGNLTKMNCMFQNCYDLASVDLSSFNTENVTTMIGLFNYCSSLTTLDLSSFDTSNVTTMMLMFSECTELTSVNVSTFDTSNTKSFEYMFMNCGNLTTLDLSSFDTSKVTSMEVMLGGCFKLSTIILGSDFAFATPWPTGADLNNGDSTHIGWENVDGEHFDARRTSSNYIPNNVADTYVWDDDYVVTFNKNDGTSTTKTQTFNYSVEEALDGNTWNRTGYTFLGWSADPDATTATYTDEESVTNVNDIQNTIYDTTTLYGVWQANAITLNDANQTFTYNPTTDQTFTIAGATNGTGSYTYSEVSEENGAGESTNFITISGTTIMVSAGAKAGTYTYVVTATDNGSGETDDATITITINKATPTATISNDDLTFNRLPQSLGSVTTNGGAVTYCATENGTYSSTCPTQTNAGTYTTYYKIAETENYVAANGSFETKIKQKPVEINVTDQVLDYPDPLTYTFTSDGDGTFSVTSSDTSIATVSITGKTITITPLQLTVTPLKITVTHTAVTGGNIATGSQDFYITIRDVGDPVITITASDYNTFDWEARDNVAVTGYAITTTNTQPTTWATVNNATVTGSFDIDANTAQTYYVWAKDDNNHIVCNQIKSYLLTKTQGTGTTLTLRENDASGAVLNTTCVLNGTNVYVDVELETGYHGLSLQKNGTSIGDESIQTISDTTTITSSSTINTYTIIYNGNNGVGSMANTPMVYGTAKNLSPNDYSRTGFEFIGWSEDEHATTATYGDEESVNNLTAVNEGTVVLYAVWRGNSISLQGGTQSFTYSPTQAQSFTISEATNGTGSYTYSEAEGTIDPDNNISIDGTTITIKAGAPVGTYTYKVLATDNENGNTAEAIFTITINNADLTGSVIVSEDYRTYLVAGVTNTDNAQLSYQWYYNDDFSTTGGTAIEGATGAELDLPFNLKGKCVYVEVTATKDNYNTVVWKDVVETWYKDYTYSFDNTNHILTLNKYYGSASDIEVNGTVRTNGTVYDIVLNGDVYSNCSSLNSVVINSGVKAGTSCKKMFQNSYNLTSIDLSNLDTSDVTDMSEMFSGCSKLTDLDLTNFDTSNVTDMSLMFSNCSKLTSLDTSGFNTNKVTDMSYMFYACSLLDSLDVSDFDTLNVTNMSYMFNGCENVISLDVSSFNTSKVTDMSRMFCNCKKITSLDLHDFDTSNVTSMKEMFMGCRSLQSLDLSTFNTSKVTDMSSMFTSCLALSSLNLTGLETGEVTDMKYMFSSCQELTSLDLSSFDTSKVTSMYEMFMECRKLETLDLSGFDTSNVTNMYCMFENCSGLTSLDLTGFDTSNVTNMNLMFWTCLKLSSLTLGDSFTFKNAGGLNNGDTLHEGWKNASGEHFDVSDLSNENFIPNNVAGTYVWDDDYVVTFDANDGTNRTTTQTFNFSVEDNLKENTFTRTGYTFLGWSADKNATAATYTDKQSVTNVNDIRDTIYDTTTLYGVWQSDNIALNDASKTLTFSTTEQSFYIEPATNGTGSYTYSEVSEKNGSGEATDFISINGTLITVSANTPSGTYTYRIKATDNGSGEEDEATITIMINTATIVIEGVDDSSLNKVTDYTGSEISPNVVTVTTPTSGAIVKYGTEAGTYNLDTPQTYINAGTYTIYYQIMADNYTTKTGSYTLTINKIDPTHVVSENELTYNKSAQTLGTVTTNGGEVTYCDTEDGTYSETCPTQVNAGTYTTYYKIAESTNYKAYNGSFETTIAQKSPGISVSDRTMQYYSMDIFYVANEGDGTFSIVSSDTNVVSCSITDRQVVLETKGVGTAEITVTHTAKESGGNYLTESKTFTVTVTAGEMIVTPEDKVTDYTGSPISPNVITVSDFYNGAVVKYGTEAGTYNLDAPQTYTNAGTYTIYYKVTAPNYNDKTGSYTLTINKVEPTHVVSGNELTYNGEAQELGLVTTDVGEVTYSLTEDGTYEATRPTKVNAGTYTVYYKIAESTNYTAFAGSFESTIAQKAVVINVTNQSTEYPNVLEYTFTSDGDGTFSVESSDASIATVSISGKTITITPLRVTPTTVDITVTHTAAANGNIATGEKTFTLSIIDEAAPDITITVRNHRAFYWKATDNDGVTGHAITTTNEQPTTWYTNAISTGATYSIDEDTPQKYYVWAKDANGNVAVKTIESYMLTQSKGTGTRLYLRDNNASGQAFETSCALEGAQIYVSSALMTGYHDLVLTVNGSPILSGRTFKLDSTTTVESSATINTYTIAYNANGGTGSMPNTPMTYGTPHNLEENTFTRTGYHFLGWSEDENATTATYEDKDEVNNLTSTNDATVTLYAIWEANDISLANQSKELSFSLNSQNFTIDGATNGAGSYTYTGETSTYFTISETTITVAANTPAGTYTFIVTATDNNTGKTDDATITITINKIEPTHVVSTPELTYNGEAQTLGSVTTNGGEVTYSLTEDGTYETTCPSMTNAGTYKVYYKIAESTNYTAFAGSFETTITQKAVVINVENQTTEYPLEKVYTFTSDGDGTFTVTSSDPTIATVTIEGKTITITPISPNTSTVTITVTHTAKDGGNYLSGSKDFEFTIVDASAPSVSINVVDYNTFAWTATDSGGVKGYAITTTNTQPTTWTDVDGSSVTESFDIDPNEAHTYYVWTKDVDGNIGVQTVTSYKITKTQGTGTTLTLRENDASGAEIGTTCVLTGTKIYVDGELADGYYNLVIKNNGTTIADGSIVTIDETTSITSEATIKSVPTHDVSGNSSLTYNGQPQELGTVTTNGGKVTYSLNESGPYSEEVPTKTDAGTYTVYYKIEESETTAGYQGQFTSTINKKDVTITIANQHSEFPEIVTCTFVSDGDGTFRVESLNGNIATATISGKTITLTPRKAGAVTIKIYHDEKANGNYNSGSTTFTYTVTDSTAPRVTVEMEDADTIRWEAEEEGDVTAYAITTDPTQPDDNSSAWVDVNNQTEGTFDIDPDTPHDYYVWIKDDAGNIGTDVISTYKITRVIGEGTSLSIRENNRRGRELDDICVLEGTKIYIDGNASTGYHDLIIRLNGTEIADGSTEIVNGAVTISTQATINTYTIVYNANGGSGSMANTDMTYGIAKNLADCTFTRPGYSFIGWSQDQNATSATFANKASVNYLTYMDEGIVTLYAVWETADISLADQTRELNYNTIEQTVTIDGATNGTGSYTYSEVSETNQNGESTSFITISGTTIRVAAGAQAGTYTYVVRAIDNVTGESTEGTMTITINKKITTLRVDNQVTTYPVTKVVNVETDGDGAITATSSNAAVATVTVNGNAITITPLNIGSVVITVNQAAGTNYSGATTSFVLTVNDENAPEVSITTIDHNTFGWEVSEIGGISGYAITTDPNTPTTWITAGDMTSGTYDIDENEPHTYYVWAKDKSGNIGSSAIITYKVTKVEGEGTTLTLTADGEISTGCVIKGTEVHINMETKDGYKNAKVKVNGTETASGSVITVVSDTAIESEAKKITNSKYVVNHYLMDLDGENYTLKESQELFAIEDTLVTPAVRNYEGFKSPSTKSARVKEDNSTVIDYYYTRNKYHYELEDVPGAILDGSTPSGDYYYGTDIVVKATTEDGYEFVGWSNGETDPEISFKLGDDNITIRPIVKKSEATAIYTVEHYMMNVNGKGYTLVKTEKFTGIAGESVTPKVNSYEGFSSPKAQTIKIAKDGSSKVEYRYDRNKYELIIPGSDGIDQDKSSKPGMYYFDEMITLVAKDIKGLVFDRWSNGDKSREISFNMPAGNLTIEPIYVLEVYEISYSGDDEEMVKQIESLNITRYTLNDIPFTLVNPTKEGYKFIGWTGSNGDAPQMTVTISYDDIGDKTFVPNFEKEEIEEIETNVPETGRFNWKYAQFIAVLTALIALLTKFKKTHEAQDGDE